MATREQFHAFQTRQPFRPYRITLGSGRTFTIRHPELAACSINGREMVVYDDDGMHLLEMLMVEILEDANEPAKNEAPPPGGNGA
jgi:hypothetical protein